MGGSWMMSSLATSDGTFGSVAEKLVENLPRLPSQQTPKWLKRVPRKLLTEKVRQCLVEAYEVTILVQQYIDQETRKGRELEEVFEEVKPILEKADKPMMRADGTVDKECEAELNELRDKITDAGDPSDEDDIGGEVDDGFCIAVPEKTKPPVESRLKTLHSASKPAEEMDQVLNIHEDLILVGDPNDWNINTARKLFSLVQRKMTKDGSQEHSIEVRVPADGMCFFICSAQKPDSWRLYPGPGPTVLREGDKDLINVNWVAGAPNKVLPEAGQLWFEILGTGTAGPVKVTVRLTEDDKPSIWFTEVV